MAHDYTKKPFSKRDQIRDDVDDNHIVVYKDNDELKIKKCSTYETDYYAKNNNNDSDSFGKLVKGNNKAHIKLEDYNYENLNPYTTESKDNYKPLPVKREIVTPCNLKYHFITDPDYNENPFKSSMKNDYPLYNKYQKEKLCEKQDKAQFNLGYDTNDNKTLYNDSFAISNDKTKESYQNSKILTKFNTIDNIKLDIEGPKGFKDVTTTHRYDFRNDRAERTKVFNNNRKVFDGIKDIETGDLLNLSWEFDPVKESLTRKDYTIPKVDEKDRFKKAKSDTYNTNPYLKTYNKQDNDHPKLSITKTDYVNYPDKYKYNPRRPLNSKFDNHLFQDDVYNDESKPRYYRSCYETDYQKVDHPVRAKSYSHMESFDTTLNELFPKEFRCHSMKKQSVTHKNFNQKEIPPYYRANKYEIEKEYIDIIEHNNAGDPDNKKISITHSSYIAPEITIDHAKMPIPLRNKLLILKYF
ncbi:hypothetical protein H8356DRAFT_944955 [Neocallimastix lanati (nom. inval.)]|nr:hypothetical protein H8356DRAFT_944955 [Neocallimastix sp. JGI-2020a]